MIRRGKALPDPFVFMELLPESLLSLSVDPDLVLVRIWLKTPFSRSMDRW